MHIPKNLISGHDYRWTPPNRAEMMSATIEFASTKKG
jgi:hypothetical protein